MAKRDYAKEANQLHIAFHEFFLDGPKDDKAVNVAHQMFDTLILWVEEMQKEIYRLEGALDELRRVVPVKI